MSTETIIKAITVFIPLITALITLITLIIKKRKSGDKTTNNKNHTDTNNGTSVQMGPGSTTNIINGVVNDNDAQEHNITETYQEMTLNDVYTSLFAEDNKLKTEQIHITKQENGNIEGTVSLQEISKNGKTQVVYTYSLIGKYTNKVLTAEYFSKENRIDERGTINLKLIDSDILSGFCSFSKLSTVDDEIRVSPYVWVAGENKDLLNGTFDFCNDCYNENSVCCCANELVDMPILLDSEVDGLRNHLAKRNQNKDTYSSKLQEPFDETVVRQMNRIDKHDDNGNVVNTKCHFFDLDGKKCRIYEGRPIDCRLFPFDIKLSKDKSEYIIGYYRDLCERVLPDYKTMKKYAHILRPYFFLLYPYLHIITSDPVCERLKNADFNKIASFKEFVF